MYPASLFVAVFLLAGRACAHIEMSSPPPFRSKYNPATPSGQVDYSMTAPLAADGSNFPCKGYQSDFDSTAPVATLHSGSNFAVTLAGTATHGGGSCQFAVSYDKGSTWVVIASVEGGCPIGLSYSIAVPSLPASDKAIFAWTWFNKVGNREMYMNCAAVKIAGSASSYTGPGLFRANTFADGTCKTNEGQDYVFPSPGPSVQYGGSITSSSPATVLTPCSHNQNTQVTVGGSSSGLAGPAIKKSLPPPPASKSILNAGKSDSSILSPAAAPASTAAASQKPIPSAAAEGSTSPTDSPIRCDSRTTWSLCSNDSCTPMGSVAPGTVCTNGSIVAAPIPARRRSLVKRHRQFRSHGKARLA